MPKLSGALMRSRPRACSVLDAVIASASATSSSTAFARSYSASPLSVSESLRESRFSSRVPRCDSSSAM